MTQKELDQKLVSDIVEIFDSAKLWNKELDNTGYFSREDKLLAIKESLNQREEVSIMERIQGALDAAMDSKMIGYLTREFLKGTVTLLRYRCEKRDMVKHIDDIEYEPALNANLKEALKSELTKTGDSTIIPYRALGDAGSIRGLRESLRNALAKDIALEIIETTPGVLREKNNYLGHRIWAMTPALPVIKVTIA